MIFPIDVYRFFILMVFDSGGPGTLGFSSMDAHGFLEIFMVFDSGVAGSAGLHFYNFLWFLTLFN